VKEILLSQGKVTLVDDDDFIRLNKYKWHYCQGYARRNEYRNGKRSSYKMMILKAPPGMVVDHINGNSLDNQKKNLRICTPKENMRNKKKRVTNTSGYKGVSWSSAVKKWRVQINIDNKVINLGCHKNIIEAAMIYNLAAKKYHKEFARLNDIPNCG
jgi:hypothetical protein